MFSNNFVATTLNFTKQIKVMKCKIILSVLAIFLALNSYSQGVHLGIKTGANFNQIDGKYWENGYKANFQGGAYFTIQGAILGGQIEGVFTQSTYVAGAGFNQLYQDYFKTGMDSIQGGSFKVNYLSIPLLINIKLLPFLMMQVGPQYSGIVSVQDEKSLMKDAKALFKSGSMDGVVGIWLDLPMHFNIGARYVFGLSNINSNDGANVGSQEIVDAWRQKILQVHIGLNLF